MSVAGLLDAMRSDLPPAVRLVWLCLENHANGGRCWAMTHEQIAAEINLSVDTVSRAVQLLETETIIRVERHRRRVSVFHMLRRYGPEPEPGYRNGHAPATDDAIRPNPETELTPQNVGSTGLIETELTPQIPDSTAELTPQNAESTPELTPQIPGPESTSKNPTSKNPPTPGAQARGVSVTKAKCPDFETFWKAYPRKVSRADAATAWARATRKADPVEIMAALNRVAWATNPRFIPHPATWLNGERWLDEIDDFDPVLRAVGLSPSDYTPEWLQ